MDIESEKTHCKADSNQKVKNLTLWLKLWTNIWDLSDEAFQLSALSSRRDCQIKCCVCFYEITSQFWNLTKLNQINQSECFAPESVYISSTLAFGLSLPSYLFNYTYRIQSRILYWCARETEKYRHNSLCSYFNVKLM